MCCQKAGNLNTVNPKWKSIRLSQTTFWIRCNPKLNYHGSRREDGPQISAIGTQLAMDPSRRCGVCKLCDLWKGTHFLSDSIQNSSCADIHKERPRSELDDTASCRIRSCVPVITSTKTSIESERSSLVLIWGLPLIRWLPQSSSST